MNRLAFWVVLLLAARHATLSAHLVRFAVAVIVHLPGLVVPLLWMAIGGMVLTAVVLGWLTVRELVPHPRLVTGAAAC